MVSAVKQYRYESAVRRRAALWFGLSLLLLAGLIGLLIVRWDGLNIAAKLLGGVLLVVLGSTSRAQLARLTYKLEVGPERLQIVAVLNNRAFTWDQIVEIRRMSLPQLGKERRWACTIRLGGPRSSAVPTLVFDDQLEEAEDALREMVRYTPHAEHLTR